VARFLTTVDPARFFGAAAELGFVGLAREDVRFRAVVLEEAMNAGYPAIALALAMHDSFALPLLDRPVQGTAAVADSDGVRAEVNGDGWELHGTARCVVNGVGAELIVVRATTDGKSDSWFVVTGPAVERAAADAVLGLDDLDVADLQFNGVPAERIEGDIGAARSGHQLALAVAAVAGARAALRTTVEYVRVRKAFGRPIAEFQNTRRVLGELGARVEAVQTFVDACLAEGEISPARAAAVQLCATDLLGEAVDTGVQLHGGYGYMIEYPIARAYTAARFFRVHGGDGDEREAVLAGALGL
jgi:alkylation response protein AidB-like acyl-CoA dehydrogenase